MMLYELTKAAHIISVIVFVSGMAVVALFLRFPNADALPAIQTFDRKVTTPAMLLTWALGILLGAQGGWFSSGLWLSAKILLVLGLSGLHGMITGRLRRKVREADFSPDTATKTALLIGFSLLVAIVLLVTTKAV
ncbi:CopD family protein [uncultured Hoeflea sp.]|uniref:CopD family protein n=1 Tax=uncultured Hoeflea sp. TaxID=538666 RepID=UPI002609E729|nr:CopD family protein [uncultured Hoeflea sp.]